MIRWKCDELHVCSTDTNNIAKKYMYRESTPAVCVHMQLYSPPLPDSFHWQLTLHNL